MGGKTEQAIEQVEEDLAELTFEQMIESLTPEDIQENSFLAKKLLGVPNPDAPWVAFAHTLGSWEIAMGETVKSLQGSINTSLQLLMVLTGAQDQIQLLEYARRLKAVENRLPSMVRQIATGMLGGSLSAQNSVPLLTQLPNLAPLPTPTPTTSQYVQYPWNAAAKAQVALAPQALAGVVLKSGGAQLAGLGDNAIGVAVSVDTANKTVLVAVNGDRLEGIEASFSGLNIGDELLPNATMISGRYLITMAEALAAGAVPGSAVKVIARVLKADSNSRAIVITDKPIQPLPVIA